MKSRKFSIVSVLVVFAGVLVVVGFSQSGRSGHSDANASAESREVGQTPGDVFGAFRADLADRSVAPKDGVPVRASAEDLGRIRTFQGIEMDPSDSNTRVAQDSANSRIILSSNSEETCMFQHYHNEPSENARLPLSGGCMDAKWAFDERTPLMSWGNNQTRKNQVQVSFLVPDAVTKAVVRTSDGVVHNVPIVNNTGDIVVSEKNAPVFEWDTKDGQHYKKTLSFGPSKPDSEESR